MQRMPARVLLGAASNSGDPREPNEEQGRDRGPVVAHIWDFARKHPGLIVGASVFSAVCVAAVAAPVLSHFDPLAQDLSIRLRPPIGVPGAIASHLMGTDGLGRDVLSRLLYGARYSLTIATLAVLLSGVLGVLLGTVAGYYGGWAETVIMRTVDAQQSLPAILLALIVAAVYGDNLVSLVAILTVSGWANYARILFGVARSISGRDFVKAAISMGAHPARILWRHVLLNMLSPIIVISTLQIGRMMLLEAGLSFLGLGVPAPLPAWGTMLADGEQYILVTPWQITIPGLVITLTVWSVNIFGDGLRRALDPRSRVF